MNIADLSLSYLRNSPDCVKLVNSDGRISFLSEQGLHLLELDSLSAVVGHFWWEFWPEEHHTVIRSAYAAALQGEVRSLQLKRTMGRGTERNWAMTLSPIPGPDGLVTSVLVVSRILSKAS